MEHSQNLFCIVVVFFYQQILTKYYTLHGSITAVLCVQLHKDTSADNPAVNQ